MMKRTTYTTRNSTYVLEERFEGHFVKRESDVHALGHPIDDGFVPAAVEVLPEGNGLMIWTIHGPVRTSRVMETVVEEIDEEVESE
jgi:hypothetical protein